jgi:predicted Zn-dependent protease
MHYFLYAVALTLLTTSAANASVILLIDSAKAEAQSVVFARLKSEAGAAQQKQTGKAAPLNVQFQEALEQSLSEWRSALEDAVAKVAIANKADIAIEPSTAKLKGLQGTDRTADVVKVLDLQFAKLKFAAP